MKTFETFCPLFPGFYGTEFEYNNEEMDIENYNEENGTDYDWDNFKWDYADYHKRVSHEFVNKVERELNYFLPVKLEFQELVSPREYNFSTDSINVKCKVNLRNLIKMIKKHEEKATKYFLDKYTPSSGFIPFHSRWLADWTKLSYILERPEHRVGTLLDCLLYCEGIGADWDWVSSESWIDFDPKEKQTQTT